MSDPRTPGPRLSSFGPGDPLVAHDFDVRDNALIASPDNPLTRDVAFLDDQSGAALLDDDERQFDDDHALELSHSDVRTHETSGQTFSSAPMSESPGRFFLSKSRMPDMHQEDQARRYVPAQTPLGFTPNRTELDSPTRERLRQKFGPDYRMPSLPDSSRNESLIPLDFLAAETSPPNDAVDQEMFDMIDSVKREQSMRQIQQSQSQSQSSSQPQSLPRSPSVHGSNASHGFQNANVAMDAHVEGDEYADYEDVQQNAHSPVSSTRSLSEKSHRSSPRPQPTAEVKYAVPAALSERRLSATATHVTELPRVPSEVNEGVNNPSGPVSTTAGVNNGHEDEVEVEAGEFVAEENEESEDEPVDDGETTTTESISAYAGNFSMLRELQQLASEWNREHQHAQVAMIERMHGEEPAPKSEPFQPVTVNRVGLHPSARNICDDQFIRVSTSSLEFDPLLVGSSKTTSFRIYNECDSPVIVSGTVESCNGVPSPVVILGDAATGRLVLPPHSFGEVSVVFSPKADNFRSLRSTLAVSSVLRFAPVLVGAQIAGRAESVFVVGAVVPKSLSTDFASDALHIYGESHSVSLRIFNVGSEPRDVDFLTENLRHAFVVSPSKVRLPADESIRVHISVKEGVLHQDASSAFLAVDKEFQDMLKVPIVFHVNSGRVPQSSKLSARSTSDAHSSQYVSGEETLFPEHDSISSSSRSLARDNDRLRPRHLSVPETVRWQPLFIGTSASAFIPLTNSSERALKCTLRMDHQTVDGTVRGSFACPSEVTVEPLSSLEIEVTYSALSAGEERAQLKILSENAYLQTQLSACAVIPSWTVLPDDVLNFGGVEDTEEQATTQLVLFNPHPCDLRLQMSIEKRPRLPNDVQAFVLPQSEVVVKAGDKLSVPVRFHPRDYSREQGRRVYEATVVSRYVPTFGISRHGDSDAVGRLLTHNLTVVGVFGYTRLQVPKSLQMMHFASAIEQATARILPIRNAGTLTANVALSVAADSPFSVEPSQFILAAGETRKVSVVFHPREPGKFNDFLGLSCPGSAYRIPLTGHADESPLLVCNKPIVNFGGVAVNCVTESSIAVRNNGIDKCFLRVHLFDTDREAVEALKKLERQTGFTEEGNVDNGQLYEVPEQRGAFTLVNQRTTIIVDGKSEVSLLLKFQPKTQVAQWRGALVLESAWGAQYKIPLLAYSGCSDLLTDDRFPSGVLQLNVCGEGVGVRHAFGVRNDGDRSAYVYVSCPTAGARFHCPFPAMVIPAKSTKEIEFMLTPQEGDADDREHRDFLYAVILSHGDEIARQRRRLSKIHHLRLGDKPVFDEFDDTFVGASAADVPMIFEGEDFRFDDFYDDDVFVANRKSMRFSIVGTVVPRDAFSSLVSQPQLKTVGAHASSRSQSQAFAKADAYAEVPVTSADGPGATKARPSADWILAPLDVRLLRMFDSTTLLLANPRSQPLAFSIECNPSLLEVNPTRGIVPPYGDLRIALKATGYSDKAAYVRVSAGDRTERVQVSLGNVRPHSALPKNPIPPINDTLSIRRHVDASSSSLAFADENRPEREHSPVAKLATAESHHLQPRPVASEDLSPAVTLPSPDPICLPETSFFISDAELGSNYKIDIELRNPTSVDASFSLSGFESPSESQALFQVPQPYLSGRVAPGKSVWVPVFVYAALPGPHSFRFRINEVQISCFATVTGESSSVRNPERTPLPARTVVDGTLPPTPTPVKQWLKAEEPASSVPPVDWRAQLMTHESFAATDDLQMHGSRQLQSSVSPEQQREVFAVSSTANVTRTVPEMQQTTASQQSSSKRTLYLRDDSVVFPMTQIGVTRTRKVAVCNGSSDPITVLVGPPSEPFHCKHRTFTVKPRSYVLLPVKYTPDKEGAVFRTMTVMTADASVTSSITLYGEGWPSPLHVCDTPVYFFLSRGEREKLLLTNVSDHPVHWKASFEDGSEGRFHCERSGIIQPDATYDLTIAVVGKAKDAASSSSSSSSSSLMLSQTSVGHENQKTFSGTLKLKAEGHRHTVKLNVCVE